MEERHNEKSREDDAAEREDVGGILHMEHLNIYVPSQGPASTFYFEGLGLTRDPFANVGAGNNSCLFAQE